MSRTVEVRLRANVSQYNSALLSTGRITRQAADSIKAGWTEATGAIRKHSTEIDRVGTGMLKAGAAVAIGLGASVKAAMSWESAFAGVRKTVDELDPAFGSLESQLRSMARTMATSHEDIAAVAENAGALGVATKDIAGFTRQMIILGETTNVTADEASTSMAQLMTIMGTAPGRVGQLAAALVDLGNNGASTEAQILEMSQRIAGAGRAVGLTEAQVMGFASAIASTGINVEAGGSAISRVFTNLDRIVTQGGHKLETLNELVGGDFATAFRQDASAAVLTFVESLGRLQDQGGSITGVLDDIGIKQIYQTDVIRRLAGAHDLLAYQIGVSETAMQDGTAALVEYGKRMETAESRASVAWNNIKDTAIEAGQEMLPIVADAADGLSDLMGTFQGLPGPVKSAAVQIAGITAAALLLGGGTLKAVVAGVKLVDTFSSMAKTSPKAAAGLKKAAAAAAILAVATVALRAYGRALDDAAEASRTKSTDIATGMLKAFNQGKPFDLNSMLHFDEGLLIKQTTTGLGASMKRAFQGSWADSFGDSMNDLLFGTLTADQIKDQIGEIDSALAALAQSGNAEAAAAGFRQITQAAADAGVPIEQVLPHFREYRRELDQIAESLGLQGQISEGEFVKWLGGEVPAAVQAAIAAGDGLSDNLTDQQKEWLGLKESVDDTVKSMQRYAELALAISGSSLGVQQTFDRGLSKGVWDTDSKGKRTGSISGGILRGGGFSVKNSAGQHNLQLVTDMAGSANTFLQSLADAGADTSKLTAETTRWQKSLSKAYQEGGKNKEVADALAATYIAMPEEIAPTFAAPGAVVTKQQSEDLQAVLESFPETAETEILAPGARPSKQEVADFIDTVHDVPPETLAEVRTIANLAGVDAAQAALDRLRDKEVKIRTVYTTPDGRKFQAADGGLFTSRHGGRVMRAYADGGTDLPPIGPQRPRIEHNRGARGIQWAETGAGPWEGYVSGHPAKRARSRMVTEDIADRLGGDIAWRAADGGVLHNGKTLDYWQDALLTPLELTRLKIRIRDLQRDLEATEKYGKGKNRKSRQKLRGLDRTEARLELGELKQQLADAQTAAKLDRSQSGTIADRIERASQASRAVEDAWGAASSAVSGWAGFGGFDLNPTMNTNAAGDIWYSPATGAGYASQLKGHADKAAQFAGKLDALRKAGASPELIAAAQEEARRDLGSGIAMADAFLTDRAAIQSANESYSRLGALSSAATAAVVASQGIPVPVGAGGVLSAGAVRATIADGEMARALQGVTLTLLVDGRPIQAIVRTELAGTADAIRNASGGW